MESRARCACRGARGRPQPRNFRVSAQDSRRASVVRERGRRRSAESGMHGRNAPLRAGEGRHCQRCGERRDGKCRRRGDYAGSNCIAAGVRMIRALWGIFHMDDGRREGQSGAKILRGANGSREYEQQGKQSQRNGAPVLTDFH